MSKVSGDERWVRPPQAMIDKAMAAGGAITFKTIRAKIEQAVTTPSIDVAYRVSDRIGHRAKIKVRAEEDADTGLIGPRSAVLITEVDGLEVPLVRWDSGGHYAHGCTPEQSHLHVYEHDDDAERGQCKTVELCLDIPMTFFEAVKLVCDRANVTINDWDQDAVTPQPTLFDEEVPGER